VAALRPALLAVAAAGRGGRLRRRRCGPLPARPLSSNALRGPPARRVARHGCSRVWLRGPTASTVQEPRPEASAGAKTLVTPSGGAALRSRTVSSTQSSHTARAPPSVVHSLHRSQTNSLDFRNDSLRLRCTSRRVPVGAPGSQRRRRAPTPSKRVTEAAASQRSSRHNEGPSFSTPTATRFRRHGSV